MRRITALFFTISLVSALLFAGGSPEESSGSDRAGTAAGQEDAGFELSAAAAVDGGAEYTAPELPPQFQGQAPPAGAGRSFQTDFSRASISFDQVISGGPPKDGIPAIDTPKFVAVEEAEGWLDGSEGVLLFSASAEDGQVTHIYPLQILMYHEIVNDVVGELPVTVTYCPLCNSGVAFHRVFDGTVMDFGTTGRLRYSNLIMYDRQTETWWQQATGRAIAGKYAGGELRLLPVLLLSWSNAKERYPDAQVLSRDTGYSRPYGSNPYTGYDSASRPFLYRGPETEPEQDPMSRVLTVQVNGAEAGYPYTKLREERVIMDTVGGRDIAVFWQPGTASALDASSVAAGRDVGTANAFLAVRDGEALAFSYTNGHITDAATGSRWDVSGTAISGPLEGSTLRPVNSVQHLWFSWSAFRRESE